MKISMSYRLPGGMTSENVWKLFQFLKLLNGKCEHILASPEHFCRLFHLCWIKNHFIMLENVWFLFNLSIVFRWKGPKLQRTFDVKLLNVRFLVLKGQLWMCFWKQTSFVIKFLSIQDFLWELLSREFTVNKKAFEYCLNQNPRLTGLFN